MTKRQTKLAKPVTKPHDSEFSLESLQTMIRNLHRLYSEKSVVHIWNSAGRMSYAQHVPIWAGLESIIYRLYYDASGGRCTVDSLTRQNNGAPIPIVCQLQTVRFVAQGLFNELQHQMPIMVDGHEYKDPKQIGFYVQWIINMNQALKGQSFLGTGGMHYLSDLSGRAYQPYVDDRGRPTLWGMMVWALSGEFHLNLLHETHTIANWGQVGLSYDFHFDPRQFRPSE